jgi:hypothetical protein
MVVSREETTMPGKNTQLVVSHVTLALFLSGVLGWANPSAAGILDATWTAPTTNTDGTPLTDLASYLLYYGTSTSPCPGSSSVQVASPTSSPGPSQTTSFRLTGLTTGTLYNVAVTAVDALGNQSACSSVASAVARSDFAVSPAGTVNFGSVTIGSFADQVFTVSNTGGGTVSGAASTSPPFSVASGSPFTLGGVGATQTVTVRFTPTTTATASATVSFTANGGSSSAIATGSGAAAPVSGTTNGGSSSGITTGSGAAVVDTTPPTIAMTAPLAGATISGNVTVSASATDNVGVVGVQFLLDSANLGAEVTMPPYAVIWDTTTAGSGAHTLSAVARDAAGNLGTSAGVPVTVANASATASAITGPVISQLTLSVRSFGATIGWTTDTPSDTQVEYGLTTSYGSLTPLNNSLVTSHSQVIRGLRPHTWYHVRIRSRDAAGNLSVSGDVTFRTRSDD